MELKGEYRIAAPRQRVWEALNDPEVLRACIPGCEELEKTGENAFAAKVTSKVGPVKAKFAGEVALSNINPPESYTIGGEGKGGAAGFAKGSADVHLTETADGQTDLSYVVQANVGGKLAQLGTRLIQGTAKKLADDFFNRFRGHVEDAETTSAAEAAAAQTQAPPPTSAPAEASDARAATEADARPDVAAEDVPAAVADRPPASAHVGEAADAHAATQADAAPPPAKDETTPEPAAATSATGPAETPPRPDAASSRQAPDRPSPSQEQSALEKLKAQGIKPVTWIIVLVILLILLILVAT